MKEQIQKRDTWNETENIPWYWHFRSRFSKTLRQIGSSSTARIRIPTGKQSSLTKPLRLSSTVIVNQTTPNTQMIKWNRDHKPKKKTKEGWTFPRIFKLRLVLLELLRILIKPRREKRERKGEIQWSRSKEDEGNRERERGENGSKVKESWINETMIAMARELKEVSTWVKQKFH